MENRFRVNRLMLEHFHLLLQLHPSLQRCFAVPATTNSANSFLEGKSKFGLFTLEKKMWQASVNNSDSLLGRNLPRGCRSPVFIPFVACHLRLDRTSKNFLAPQRKSRITVRKLYSDEHRCVMSPKLLVKLSARVDVDTSLAVDKSGESDPFNLGWHDGSPKTSISR